MFFIDHDRSPMAVSTSGGLEPNYFPAKCILEVVREYILLLVQYYIYIFPFKVKSYNTPWCGLASVPPV